jgi:hypothetical protein
MTTSAMQETYKESKSYHGNGMTWSLRAPTQAMLGWETVIPLRFIMFVHQSFHELELMIHILRSWYSGVSLSEQNA